MHVLPGLDISGEVDDDLLYQLDFAYNNLL